MSKTKPSGPSHYEMLFIIPNRFTEEEAKTVSEKTEKMVADNGGQITRREYWGKKKLAYEIKHNGYGYYSLLEFDLEGSSLAKLNQTLKLSTDVLRHQIIAKRIKSSEEIARDEKIQAKIDSKRAAEKSKAKEEEVKQTEKGKTKDDKRVELKDLDQKLEGILNADDLI